MLGTMPLAAFSQLSFSECKTLILEAHEKQNIREYPADNDIIYLFSFKVITKTREDDDAIESQSAIYIGKNQMKMVTDEVEIYQDRQDAFTLMKSKSEIYHSTSQLFEDREKRMNQFHRIQDTLLKVSEVSECTSDKDNSDSIDLIIKLKPNEFGRKSFRTREIIYHINQENLQIKKVKYLHTPDNPIEYSEWFFIALDFNYREQNLFSKPVKDLFLDDNGELREEFSAYDLIVWK